MTAEKVQFSNKTKGANQVIAQIEATGTRSVLSAKIENPPARFHEMQVGAEDANFIITNYVYPRQRNVSLQWAVEIGILIESGDLLPTTVHFAHCKEDGRVYLVDGYHRMAGTAMAIRPMLYPVEHHYCDTMKEVDRVYARLDQGAPRSVNAAIRATGYDAQVGLPENKIPQIASAAAVIKTKFRQPAGVERIRSSSRKLDMVDEWVYEARLFLEVTTGGNSFITSRLWNSGHLAVALTIMRYAPEKGREFFYPVANMACGEGTPQQAFLSSMLNRADKKASAASHARTLANAWNAFVDGRNISKTYAVDPGRPIDILLTPWAGPKRTRDGGANTSTTEQNYRDVKPAVRPEEP